jgi:hypothetical protein
VSASQARRIKAGTSIPSRATVARLEDWRGRHPDATTGATDAAEWEAFRLDVLTSQPAALIARAAATTERHARRIRSGESTPSDGTRARLLGHYHQDDPVAIATS